MKLYRSDWTAATEGRCVAWHGSQREAAAHAVDVKREHTEDAAFYGVETKPVGVPTAKEALVAFLNRYAGRDNG